MTKNSNIEMLTKEILKSSYLEVTDPDFNGTTMKKILHESRRRRILENIFLCFLAFAAVDTLIFLVLWLLGLNVFNIALQSSNMPREILFQIGELRNSLVKNEFIMYVMLSFGGIMALLTLLESKFKSRERVK
ncbi:MAG: hypothetical protein WAV76_06350 [Bacteroidota bacterium]